MAYKAIVIGSSAGGLNALKTIILGLRKDFMLPIIIVQHISPHSDSFMARYFNQISPLHVKEADEREPVRSGHVYLAPPNFHLLVEEDQTLSLSVEEKVNFSRPSIDILFETASYVWGKHLIGIILTGANNDGASGLEKIARAGGLAIIQSPESAEVPIMPMSAMDHCPTAQILPLNDIPDYLNKINQ